MNEYNIEPDELIKLGILVFLLVAIYVVTNLILAQ
ncbi:hypothetical protein UFOVP1230_33 [uncultured Caudovirales phage]|uniref:Uncharacterized protein n=1 Tax=uncultured Caudovirales phage TaxID=2100421 RepID=A0A6J5RC11_9CAUD|nr:hypothetical protein UFOVP1230_33 [uncultured Caudovirales phage]|tara:strand:+ start:5087 stop:5191 length:105 start_codon:yes stop_codon:yes gene_type:complete